MTSNPIQTLNLENYAVMAARMVPGSLGLVICDAAGEQLAASGDTVVEHTGRLTELQPDWPERIGELERLDVADCGVVHIMNLDTGSDPTAGFLLWWLSDAALSDAAGQLHDALMCLGVCVRNELELQTELDSMALELSERYEELNLVYHTEDQVSFFREGQEAFRALVQNCSDYLNADLAVLLLRDKGVMVASRSDLDSYDVRLVRSLLESDLYEKVVTSHDVEFMNNEAQYRESEAAPIPYRLMAGPVISFGEQPDGVLVIANFLSSRPFSNSDKNLLTVMSRKAAKIVQGSYDGLTDLLNRASFEHLVNNALAGMRSGGGEHCLLHLNIDKLHRINETVGHDAGDLIIRSFAKAIVDDLRDTDVVARLGGDELGVLIHNCSVRKGTAIAEKLAANLASLQLDWSGEELRTTISVGLASLIESARNGEQAMKHAVTACEVAKENGGNCVQVYELDDVRLLERESNMWMVGTVHAALREGRFRLYAQPIQPLARTGGTHLEILLRMLEGNRVITPSAFLPASERYQMMTEVDRWVIENSLLEIAQYLEGNPRVRPIFGINLSGQSFCSTAFQDFALDMLERSNVPAELICFEITETAAVSNMARAQEFIAALRARGCAFALDDFGAGVSSFGYLKSFDVQYLKIDGALIRDIERDRISAAMVESVNQIGHVMGLKTIAEFVETPGARTILQKIGVDYIQGFLIGKPAPIGEQLAALNAKPAVSAV